MSTRFACNRSRSNCWFFYCAMRDKIVSREHVRRELWTDHTFVDFDHGLAVAVNKVREAIGDSSEKPRFIETLPRRGFRFIATVSRQDVEAEQVRTKQIDESTETQGAPPRANPVGSWKRIGSLAAGVALLGIWVVHRFVSPSEVGRNPTKFTQISHWNKPMEWVRISPDGRVVAFTSPADGVQQVFLLLTAGGTPVQLTTDPNDKLLNNFSADGSEIFYLQGKNEAWAVPTLGGKPRRLLPGSVGGVVPSHDGASIFYTRNANTEVFRADKSGLNEEMLFKSRGSSSQLSLIGVFPGGDDMLTSSWTVGSPLRRRFSKLNLKTGSLLDLGGEVTRYPGAAWDKPGSSIIFSRKMNGLTNLWEYDLTDRSLRQITFGPGPDRWPLRDPAGKGVFYVNGKASGHLTAYHVRSKEVKDVVSDDASQPALSPDRQHLMYVTFFSPPAGDLWVSDADGQNKLRIATSESIKAGKWARDNFHLCFMAGDAMYVVGADGSGLRKFPRSSAACVWSCDQKSIYTSSEERAGAISTWKWDLEVTGRGEEKVADNCGFVTDSDPTGRYLLSNDFISAAGRGINEISLSDGRCISLLPNVHTSTSLFSRDGKSFLYAIASPAGTTIYRQQWSDGKLAGSSTAQVNLAFSVQGLGFMEGFIDYDFSSDLSTIVYARPDRRADLYLISLE